ncbi:MAG: putative DNA binding domain-containing protein [Bacteroidales bacterium]|nr:putative DNA binding domain-containing protein [Bacteroidales bacterium]
MITNMTKEELLSRLNGIEWNDFEIKEAKNEVPKTVWETVSAFSNSYGGWIVFGVKEKRAGGKSTYEIQGVENTEKLEQDFVTVLRSNGKFNQRISVQTIKFDIDKKVVLAFYIPMSEYKPVYISVPTNTYIRLGSGDQRATEFEVRAMQRDQAFGKKSNEAVFGTCYKDINQDSFQDYRAYLRAFNSELSYNTLSDTEFAVKTGIMSNGLLSVGGLLMFGNIDAILRYNPDFLIDYIEIPGSSIQDAKNRYTYRLQEQENIWEYYKIILHRLRTRIDNPYLPRPDGIAPDDNTLLYCVREALVNFCAHADYFSEIHSTVRVFDTSIQFQNPGSFPVNLKILGQTIVSQPRNPNILRFFKLARLSENGGYGIDKILNWKNLTNCAVTIDSDITKSEVRFELPINANQRQLTPNQRQLTTRLTPNSTPTDVNGVNLPLEEKVLALIITNNKISIAEIASSTGKSRRNIDRVIDALKKSGKLVRLGSARRGHWVVR